MSPVGLPSIDLLTIFYKLLPGFLAAAAFHSLTPYPKRDVPDRIVAALIFTLFAQLGVAVIREALLWTGSHVVVIGPWTTQTELGWGAAIGVLLGVVWSHAINNGKTHSFLRKWGTTKKTSLPSQWYSAFASLERFVVLHLKDGRRVMGWPRQWPDEPENGHFLLELPIWLLNDGNIAPMDQIEAFLVAGSDVKCVEFLRDKSDPVLAERKEAIGKVKILLLSIQKESAGGKQGQAESTH